MKQSISLDFDGVVHDYSDGWMGYVPSGEPIPGALDFVRWAMGQGYEVIISSCRAYTQIGRDGIRYWLEKHDFPVEFMPITCEKPHATWYVDDRGIRFEGCFEQVRTLMERPVWFQAKKEPDFGGQQ